MTVGRFTAKMGGLPVWVWALILGLILVAGMYWYRARGVVVAAPAGGATGTGALDSLIGGGGTVGSPSSAVGGDTSSGSDFVSNATWLAQGMALLIGQGMSPIAAQQALEHYINGDPLTPAEADGVNRVVAAKGIPPQGTTATPSLVSETPATPATPAAPAYINADGSKTTAGAAFFQAGYVAAHPEIFTAATSLQAKQYVESENGSRDPEQTQRWAARFVQDHGSWF